jgi:hypothetical protein
VHTGRGAGILRVRLTNRFGANPVTFGDGRVGLRRSGPSQRCGHRAMGDAVRLSLLTTPRPAPRRRAG